MLAIGRPETKVGCREEANVCRAEYGPEGDTAIRCGDCRAGCLGCALALARVGLAADFPVQRELAHTFDDRAVSKGVSLLRKPADLAAREIRQHAPGRMGQEAALRAGLPAWRP